MLHGSDRCVSDMRYLVCIVLMLSLSACRATKQTSITECATQLSSLDSLHDKIDTNQVLTVRWWGEPPSMPLPEDTLYHDIDHYRNGGYSIELRSEEHAERLSRVNRKASTEQHHLTREKSEPTYIYLRLGLLAFGLLSLILGIRKLMSR